jgi:hypothetical protein
MFLKQKMDFDQLIALKASVCKDWCARSKKGKGQGGKEARRKGGKKG